MDLVAPQFAFRSHHQAHEVIWTLGTLIEKANEWQVHLFVLDGDVHKAYDFTRHEVCIRSLRKKHVPDILVAAWMREVRRSRSIFRLSRDVTTAAVART
eukprot:4661429-Karenia_brevis.AAC.1